MKIKLIILLMATFVSSMLVAQNSGDILSSSERMLESDKKLTIGGYGQIDYNQPFQDGKRRNGTLDVHRMILLFGYSFNERTNFVAELEVEHVEEVYIEQAFIDYRIKPWLNFRGGLMLIPMGIVNEYHEPPTFNGVERPNVDSKIVPTTWREIGAGFTGNISSASVKYQLYLVNGFKSYDGTAYLSGSDGSRKGRQKGATSFISAPNVSAKVEYYGIRGLKLGAAGYFGNTQSTLYNGIDRNDASAKAKADSSVVGIAMIGFDGRYSTGGWEFRGQYIRSFNSNTDQYNEFTKKDVGSAMTGWYLEAAYNLFHTSPTIKTKLVPFVRYEQYNTQSKVEAPVVAKASNNKWEVTTGLGWRITPSVVLKGDYQWIKSKADDKALGQLNMGIGVMF